LPLKATIHIQNKAPGPPKAIAVATPAYYLYPLSCQDIDNAEKKKLQILNFYHQITNGTFPLI
jgi:hypothetical protein